MGTLLGVHPIVPWLMNCIQSYPISFQTFQLPVPMYIPEESNAFKSPLMLGRWALRNVNFIKIHQEKLKISPLKKTEYPAGRATCILPIYPPTSRIMCEFLHLCRAKNLGNHYNQLSHEKKTSYFPLYWLVNRDPYNGLLKSLYNWVGFHPLYILTNQEPFFSLLNCPSNHTTNFCWMPRSAVAFVAFGDPEIFCSKRIPNATVSHDTEVRSVVRGCKVAPFDTARTQIW